MGAVTQQSLAQGREYESIHANQRGGAAVSLASSAPVGYTGMLDDSLRAIARVSPIDQSISAIQGMSDQSGGGRRRGRIQKISMKDFVKSILYHPVKTSRRILTQVTRGANKKLRNSMKKTYAALLKTTRRIRKMRGGAGSAIGPMADYASPGMLLTPAQEAKALMGMNPEWKLAADPASFAPKMY